MTQPLTLFEKIWNKHIVAQEPDAPAVLYIDVHLVHEVTSPQAFTGLRARGLKVRRPDKTAATVDHGLPTLPARPGDPAGRMALADDMSRKQIQQLEDNCREFGVPLYGL